MWNVYVMVKGESEKQNAYASKLTKDSVANIRKLCDNLIGGFTRFSNWIWVDSSNAGKMTGYFLKNEMNFNGKVVDYYVETLLDDESSLPKFIEKDLIQLRCKNNIIVVSEDICKKLIRLLNNGNPVDEIREYYHFKYDTIKKTFTLRDK